MEYATRVKPLITETETETEKPIAGKVIHVESEEHRQKFISNNEVVVLKFGAEWCGPCKKIEPEYKKLAENKKEIIFLSEDIDDDFEGNHEIIKSIPCFHFFKNGKFIQNCLGANINRVAEIIKIL